MTASDFDLLAPAIADLVKAAVARETVPLLARIAQLEARELPAGPAGPAGPPGERGLIGEKGLDGAAGRDGRDGGAGATGTPGRDGVDGAKGLDGKDGAAGLGFDDFAIGLEGRSLQFMLTRGELMKVFPVELPQMIYRDVWQDGQTYAKGDAVTWGGSIWVANTQTTAKPGLSTEASRAWTLAVKRGGDGRDGKPGPDGKAGPKGDRGEPGRHG